MQKLPFLVFMICLLACSSSEKESSVELTNQISFEAVIEIPAGTNLKIEYDKTKKDFYPDIENGSPRMISYLPYPGNYGFISSTLMAKEDGGDGDAVDVLILSESQETGTIMDIIPIGVLMLLDDGERDDKVIAVPVSKELNILKVETFEQLQEKCPTCLTIIELWFSNYNPNDQVVIEGWKDEREAKALILNYSL